MFTVSIIGCGWLGSKTANYLSQYDFKVKGSSTSKQSLLLLKEKGIDGYLVNINKNTIDSIIDNTFLITDVLIISLKPNRREDDNELFESQIRIIAQLAKQNGVKKVIFWSSTSVYGDNNTIAKEDNECTPARPSGKSLLKAEQYLLSQADFTTVILRLGGLIGYNRNPFETIKHKRKAGSLYVPVNLVHADDVLQITKKAIEEIHSNSIYNVVSDKHPLRINYYKKALIELNANPEVFEIKDNNNFKIVDNHKIKRDLNYTFLLKDPAQIYTYKTLLSQKS